MADHENDVEQYIEQEVTRRVARQVRRHHDENVELRTVIKKCQNDLVRQNAIIQRLTGEPLTFGTLLRVHNTVDPAKFKPDLEVLVVDRESPHYQKGGKIIAGTGESLIDDDGYVFVKLHDDTEERFSIGLEGKESAQIRLTSYDDGSYAVVSIDGKPWEVRGIPDLDLVPGEPVKIKPDSRQIVSRGYDLSAGPICSVIAILDNGIEIADKGEKKFVHNPRSFELEEGDRVVVDHGFFCIVEKLPRDARERYKLSTDLSKTWDDIGGLDFAKSELRDALELPYQEPELFEYYGVDPLRGILLYGPPGCGKTLLARVAAWAMAQQHGASAQETGYIYVKSPEILDKWVGNTEAEIRQLFERGRRHYRECGYKAILAFDEADAIMPQRGTRRSSDVADTIVPMFLGEMDGVDENQTAENPIVILMTNRADILDPAITRPGRISKHIKIERPTEMGSIDILEIHTKGLPFENEASKMASLAVCSSDLFSKSRLLYRVNNELDFTLGDAVSGALLENIAQEARMIALHRDLAAKSRTGVTTEDFREAVNRIASKQRGVNHSYDLQDFAEKNGLQSANMQVERCFGAA